MNRLVLALATLLLSGCSMHLHPLLVKHHNNTQLADSEVDIRIDRAGAATPFKCLADDPISVWKFPALGCARLSCAENKMWLTNKMCTCRVVLATEAVLAHELRHCYGWVDDL